MHSDLLPKITAWKEGEKSDFIVKKPGKHHFSQVIKVNNGDVILIIYTLDGMRMALY